MIFACFFRIYGVFDKCRKFERCIRIRQKTDLAEIFGISAHLNSNLFKLSRGLEI